MRHVSRRLRLVLLLPCLVAWLLGSSASLIHEVVVAHVVCAEHGETVELERSGAASADPGAVPDEHEHGCSFEGVVLATSAPHDAARVGLRVPRPADRIVAEAGAPRGPPLAYAPKTSPPHRG